MAYKKAAPKTLLDTDRSDISGEFAFLAQVSKIDEPQRSHKFGLKRTSIHNKEYATAKQEVRQIKYVTIDTQEITIDYSAKLMNPPPSARAS